MGKLVLSIIAALLVFSTETIAPYAQGLSDADALYFAGGRQNLQLAIDIYEKLLQTSPDDFELNWKCARAYREFGETAKREGGKDWQKTCAAYGQKGMRYAAKAREIDPDHPAGHYFFGLSVGIYSDGTGILIALKEGLKDKTQTSFEKAYALDKMYEDAGSILALGRFWAVLPWPLANKKKALAYYREYQQTRFFQKSNEGKIYLAELLISKGGNANKAEARKLLEQTAKTDNPYFKAWAERLLKRLNK